MKSLVTLLKSPVQVGFIYKAPGGTHWEILKVKQVNETEWKTTIKCIKVLPGSISDVTIGHVVTNYVIKQASNLQYVKES